MGRKRRQAPGETGAAAGCLPLLGALAGALCLCVAALLVDGTREALAIWHWRDGYVRADLEVQDLSTRSQNVRLGTPGGSANVYLWVPAGRFPELMRSRDGIVFRAEDAQALKGRTVRAWLNLAAWNFALGDVRALSASSELPGLASAVRRGLMLVAFVALGAGLMRAALRSLSAA